MALGVGIKRYLVYFLVLLAFSITAATQDSNHESDSPEHETEEEAENPNPDGRKSKMPVLHSPENEGELKVTVEEIRVTARRREEDIQKVPLAVTAFSERSIGENGIHSVEDFAALMPNFSIVNRNTGSSSMTIRGISQVFNGEAPVAVLIDGVSQVSPNSINQELSDIRRIEVLKGPQGALYGRNSIGGAISIVTEPARFDWQHQLKMGIGNGESRNLAFSSGGPLFGEKLLYRVSAAYEDREGLIPNESRNEMVDAGTEKNLALRLSAFPSRASSIDFKATVSDTRDGGLYYIPTFGEDTANQTGSNPSFNDPGEARRELTEISLETTYAYDVGTLTSVSAYHELEDWFRVDLDYLPITIMNGYQILDVQAISQELRFASPDDREHRWLAGLYLSDTDRGLNGVVDIDLDQDFLFDAQILHLESNDNRAFALFGQWNHNFSEAWEVSAALRYDHEKREQVDRSIENAPARDLDFDALQPRLTASYSFRDGFMTYLTYAEGFRSGGFNVPNNDAFLETYTEENAENSELGFKARWFADRLQINGNLFYTRFRGQQFYGFHAETGAQGIINIDRSVIRGLEIDMDARLSPSLTFLASVGALDTEIKEFENNSPALAHLGTSPEGNQTPLAEDLNYNLRLHYQGFIDTGSRFSAQLSYERRGKTWWHIDNADFREPFGLLDARASFIRKSWTLSAFVSNLTDRRYNNEFFAGEFMGYPYDIRWPGNPRAYGFEWRKRF